MEMGIRGMRHRDRGGRERGDQNWMMEMKMEKRKGEEVVGKKKIRRVEK